LVSLSGPGIRRTRVIRRPAGVNDRYVRALLTVGHGTFDRVGLQRLLLDAAVDMVVDVRRYPGSRRNPDVRRVALEQWLPAAGIDYRWDERLGGRRHLSSGVAPIDTWWNEATFQAYAAHTRSDEFAAGMADLLVSVPTRQVAIMCSETLWWRCHRRLIADVATLAHDTSVDHLLPSGHREPHQLAAGARLRGDGHIVWDGGASQLPIEP
jgi:uncharacterized protein (DUF488 family)